MSYAALLQELGASQATVIELKEKVLIATDPGAVDFYESCYASAVERVKLVKEEIDHVKKHRRE